VEVSVNAYWQFLAAAGFCWQTKYISPPEAFLAGIFAALQRTTPEGTSAGCYTGRLSACGQPVSAVNVASLLSSFTVFNHHGYIKSYSL